MRSGQILATGWRFRFEDGPWEQIELPHTWNALDTMSTDPDFYYRRGTGTYELDFKPPADAEGRRLWVSFSAVAQRGWVYFDDVLVGEHHGGYTRFDVEIPNRPGVLRVEANNSPDIDLIPSDLSDFYLYGGITRPVTCYHTGQYAIERLFFDVDTTADRATLRLRGRLDSQPTHPLTLQVTLTDNDQTYFIETTSIPTDEFSFTLPDVAAPHLWSPDDPYLYAFNVQILEDGVLLDENMGKLGFRWFDFPSGGPFYLNGERLLLKGTHRHDDWAGHGAAVPQHLVQQELEAIKNAGFNFLRLGHYPQDDFVLHLCDSLGLIVWEELPWCRGGVGGEAFKDKARAMLVEMIEQHYNHPSIVFWGLGNELDWESEHPGSSDEIVADFLSELQRLSHQLDARRMTALRRFEPGAQIVDVYSPSIWSGWYRGRYEDYEQALRQNMTRYPHMLHIEWGGDSHVGRHNDGPHINVEVEMSSEHGEVPGTATSEEGFARYSRDGDWSESYIVDLMHHHLMVQAEVPQFAGGAQWVFKDFGTPLRPENPVPYVNQKGLLTRDGAPKDAYYVFRAFQSTQPVVHIESSGDAVYAGKQVRVITNCDAVELLIDGQTHGIKQRENPGVPAALLIWDVSLPPDEVDFKAIGYRMSQVCAEHRVKRVIVKPDQGPVTDLHIALTSEPDADGKSLSVQLMDANGNPVTTDERRICFEAIQGGAISRWQGIMGESDVVQTANGRAWVRLLPAAGTAMHISIAVDGMGVKKVVYHG